MIAREWQALARFYETVFGCVRVPPERDLAGPAMAAGTGIPAAHLRGVHLCLPGYGDAGPTLEIFTYDRLEEQPATAVNRPGFGHLAFSVTDVAAARAAVLAAGGQPVGQVVTVTVAGGGRVTWCYVTDPEGNVIDGRGKEPLGGIGSAWHVSHAVARHEVTAPLIGQRGVIVRPAGIVRQRAAIEEAAARRRVNGHGDAALTYSVLSCDVSQLPDLFNSVLKPLNSQNSDQFSIAIEATVHYTKDPGSAFDATLKDSFKQEQFPNIKLIDSKRS